MAEPASLLELIRFGYGPKAADVLVPGGVDPDRLLAQRSVQLLAKYRSGQAFDRAQCPLHQAVAAHLPTRTIG